MPSVTLTDPWVSVQSAVPPEAAFQSLNTIDTVVLTGTAVLLVR